MIYPHVEIFPLLRTVLSEPLQSFRFVCVVIKCPIDQSLPFLTITPLTVNEAKNTIPFRDDLDY